MLDKQAVQEFKEAYRNVYGTDIADDKAFELAVSLLNIFRVVYRSLDEITNATNITPPNPIAGLNNTVIESTEQNVYE